MIGAGTRGARDQLSHRIAARVGSRRSLILFQVLIESPCAQAYIGRNMAVPAVATGMKGRPSSYLGRMLPPYTKPHLSFADQLALLEARGLDVTDQARAILHLQRIGYGRLSPYWQPFQQIVPDPNDAIDTAGTAGTLVFHIMAAMAEMERDLIRERTTAALIIAKRGGRIGGRKTVMTPRRIEAARKLLASGMPAREIAPAIGVSVATLCRHLPAATQEAAI